MKTRTIVLGIAVLVIVLAIAAIGVGTALAQGYWGRGAANGWPMGPGMMGGAWRRGPFGSAQGAWCGGSALPGQSPIASLDEARAAVSAICRTAGTLACRWRK